MKKELTPEQLKKRKKTNLTIIIIAIILFALIGHFASNDQEPESVKSTISSDSINEPSPDTLLKQNIYQWFYQTTIDKMDGDSSQHATLQSETGITFPFPYDYSDFYLSLRHRKNNNDFMISCSSCQFLSGIYGDKEYRVKFDDEKPFSVNIYSSSDGDSKIVFLSNEKLLIAKLKKAKTFIIEPEFYESGLKTITFNVSGLQWKY